jgi:cell division protein FtsB
MTLKLRIIISLGILLISLFFGAIGGLLGPKLPIWIWMILVAVLAMLLLPWKNFVWSQEALLQDILAYEKALDELQQTRSQLRELAETLDQSGGLKDAKIQELGEQFTQLQQVSTPAQKVLRESLFGLYRRILAMQIVALVIAAFGSSLMAYYFAQWLQ